MFKYLLAGDTVNIYIIVPENIFKKRKRRAVNSGVNEINILYYAMLITGVKPPDFYYGLNKQAEKKQADTNIKQLKNLCSCKLIAFCSYNYFIQVFTATANHF